MLLDFDPATAKDVPKLLDEVFITSITSSLPPPLTAKAQFSFVLNWAFNIMVSFRVHISVGVLDLFIGLICRIAAFELLHRTGYRVLGVFPVGTRVAVVELLHKPVQISLHSGKIASH